MEVSLLSSLAFAVVLWWLWRLLFRHSPLDRIPGPARASFFFGHLPQFFTNSEFRDCLGETYDGVATIDGMFGEKQLYVFDPKALQAIFVKDQYAYEQPEWFTASNSLIFGAGLVSVSGAMHRKLRKILNPLFSKTHMRQLMPVINDTMNRFQQALAAHVGDTPRELDMLHWASRGIFETTGQAILGCSFDPLVRDVSHPFERAIKGLVPSLSPLAALRLVVVYINRFGTASFRRWLAEHITYPAFQTCKAVIDSMDSEARKIVEERKAAILQGDEDSTQQAGQRKDLLSVLIRANANASDEDKLSDSTVVAQVTTMVFGATDTTGDTVSRILYLLAEHPNVQDRLRQELREKCDDGEITYDQLMELPLLDAVVRETMRLHPVLMTAVRVASRDTILPLMKPVHDRNGAPMSEVVVPKGTTVAIGLRSTNRYKAIWGSDANEWKPERWSGKLPGDDPETQIPGVSPNLMTFAGGPQACVGYRLAELMIRAVVRAIVQEYKLTLTKTYIHWNMALIIYPSAGEDHQTPQLPLIVEKIAG